MATSGASYVQLTDGNGSAAVVLAAEESDFPESFMAALGQQRFWDRV